MAKGLTITICLFLTKCNNTVRELLCFIRHLQPISMSKLKKVREVS